MTMITMMAAAVPSVISGVLLYEFNRNRKRAEQSELDNRTREKLTLDFLNATQCVTKEAVQCLLYDKKPNGELQEAFDYMQSVKHELEDYERDRASR